MDARITEAATYGLRFAIDKQGLTGWQADVDAMAAIVATHVLTAAENSGAMVPRERYTADLDKQRERAGRFERSWASSTTQADRQLQRVQRALAALPDRELAQRLADEVGVILPDPK